MLLYPVPFPKHNYTKMFSGLRAGTLPTFTAWGYTIRPMRSGFVYVFSNPGLSAFKVGMTTRALYLRASELTREYGTVYPFEIASRHAVDDPAAVEALAHRILARYRVPRSELFACDLATCHRAVKAAAVLVLERPWWLRCWHWVTLPRPAAPARRGRPRRASGAGSLLFLFSVVALAALLVHFQPALPSWFPSSVIRAAYLLERFRH